MFVHHFNGKAPTSLLYFAPRVLALLAVVVWIAMPAGQARADLDAGLVAYYPFNGNADDASDNGNDGVVNGATLTEDRFGNPASAYHFNSNSQYISAQSSDELSQMTEISISAWIRTNGILSGYWWQTIVSKGATYGDLWADYSLALEGNDVLIWENSNSSNDAEFTQVDAPLNIDQWHHVASTYDGSEVSIYLDGNLLVTSPITNNYIRGSDQPLYIGIRIDKDIHPHESPFHGEIDEVRIYNRALSSDEVVELASGTSAGLVAHYQFENNAYDSSGYGNDGLAHGGVTYDAGVIGLGQAAVFDGISGYIDVPHSPSLAPTEAVTVSTWIRSTYQGQSYIQMKSECSTQHNRNFWLTGNQGYSSAFGMIDEDWNYLQARCLHDECQDVWDGEWHHIAGTYDRNELKYFVDGQLVSVVPHTVPINVSTGTLAFARDCVGHRFPMELDDFRIYNRALSPGEISEFACIGDADADGICATEDNCPDDPNPDQADQDGDNVGDVCDEDVDGDGVGNISDNCPTTPNSEQVDTDTDGEGNVCDSDDDGDGIGDGSDNCPQTENAGQQDNDGDAVGDACDGDIDGDGVGNAGDNCPEDSNTEQTDTDSDTAGDACDSDDDNDGIGDEPDNCQYVINIDQTDTEGDGIGDACDADDDGDAIEDPEDNCPLAANSSQLDTDADGEGDVCDLDDDDDGVPDGVDNCPLSANGGQANNDGDALGDACDPDDDNDGVADVSDNCPWDANTNQVDNDGDGAGDVCDLDDDNDGVADVSDNCPNTANVGQEDLDGDQVGDACDSDSDRDGDGVANEADNCPLDSNSTQLDMDGDGEGDACDADLDGDGVGNGPDNCPYVPNPAQADNEEDGLGDLCDPDDDNDGVDDPADNCPWTPNPDQFDFDGDGPGDACDPDVDGDGVPNEDDLCAYTALVEAVDPEYGCAVVQYCPCEGPRGQSEPWRNKGKFMSCLGKTAESFMLRGLISEDEKEEFVREGATECAAP